MSSKWMRIKFTRLISEPNRDWDENDFFLLRFAGSADFIGLEICNSVRTFILLRWGGELFGIKRWYGFSKFGYFYAFSIYLAAWERNCHVLLSVLYILYRMRYSTGLYAISSIAAPQFQSETALGLLPF